MTDLTSMMNIGREMARKLRAAGVYSAEDLREIGAKQAFFQLKALYPNVCLVHLYALEGAIQNRPYNDLPAETQRELKSFSDILGGGNR